MKLNATLRQVLREIRVSYPEPLRWYVDNNFDRIVWQATVILEHMGGLSGVRILDVGAGLSASNLLLAAQGADVTIIDDFADLTWIGPGAEEAMTLLDSFGVNVISGDVFTLRLPFSDDELDVVVSFDSMEHWHNSPKRVFKKIYRFLKPGGLFFLGVPNCVNIRKRITVPFGYGKWSSMEDWYETDVFRGHVREPDVADLLYIARDLGLREAKVVGRNWIGYRSPRPFVRQLTPVLDRLLQLNPALCSDIYLYARK